jgi:hypothetical protein
MFGTKSYFKTTIIKNFKGGDDAKLDAKMEKVSENIDKASAAMNEASDSMTDMFKDFEKGFDPAKEGLSMVSETEVYGTTKAEALQEANKMSQYGYKLVSLEEDSKLKVWNAKLRMEK